MSDILAVPPELKGPSILESAQKQLEASLAHLLPERRTALVGVVTDQGAKMAFVTRQEKNWGTWEMELWVEKEWEHRGAGVGGTVICSFR